MNDMRAVIIPKSDQLTADDLLAGPITITIREVTIRPGTEQPVSIFYDGDNGKPYKCCKSMARVMVTCWGPDANEYTGRSMTLYCDPKIMWGGMAVGGIRISHMSHIKNARTMPLTATKGSKKPFTVQPLDDLSTREPARNPVPKSRGPKDWLNDMARQLSAAPTQAALDAILVRPEVVQNVEYLEGLDLYEWNALLADNMARLHPPGIDDGSAANEPDSTE